MARDSQHAYECSACGLWHLGTADRHIAGGFRVSDRTSAEIFSGVDEYAVRVCPGCGGEGTVSTGLMHAARCAHSAADLRDFPRRPR